jgi:hypothetical protein
MVRLFCGAAGSQTMCRLLCAVSRPWGRNTQECVSPTRCVFPISCPGPCPSLPRSARPFASAMCILTSNPVPDGHGTDVDPRNVEAHAEPVCPHVQAASVPARVLPGGNGRDGVHGGAEQHRGFDYRVPAIPGGGVRPSFFLYCLLSGKLKY